MITDSSATKHKNASTKEKIESFVRALYHRDNLDSFRTLLEYLTHESDIVHRLILAYEEKKFENITEPFTQRYIELTSLLAVLDKHYAITENNANLLYGRFERVILEIEAEQERIHSPLYNLIKSAGDGSLIDIY